MAAEVETNRRGQRSGKCPFCGRTLSLTFHHLIPKKVHRRVHFKKRYDKETLNQGVRICRDCHKGVHKRYTEMELAKTLNTPEQLRNDPDLARHFAWVAKQKAR